MSLLFETTVKISIVVALALGATAMLRHRSAAVRHWVLAAAVLCAVLTPVLIAVGPSWSLPIPSASSANSALRASNTSGRLQRASDPQSAPVSLPADSDERPATSDPLPARWLPLAWLMGVAINLGILLVGLSQLTWFASRAREVTSGRWAELARDVSQRLRLRRSIRLLQSDHPSLLVTWGLFTPKVMLPDGAPHWPDDRIRIVLSHELAHIRRGDWLVQIGGELLRSFFWFNPLLWLVCSRLRLESEHACDDAVVNLGVEGREYATHLLELARVIGKQRRMWFPAPAIAPRRSGLERRVSAMLNRDLNRRPMTRLARVVTVVMLAGVTLPLAGFAQNTFATVSGSVVDQLDGFLPAVSVVVTDARRQAKHEVRTDRTGRFEFVGLPEGDYLLEAAIAGFKTFQAKLTLAGQDVQRDIRMQIGSLEETVTVIGSRSETVGGVASIQTANRRPLPPCSAAVGGGIGGNIRQPHKVRHVTPLYPTANVEGIVTLDTLIGTNGFMKDVRVVSSPHPDLTRTAVEAVRQWEFDETLLNCVPVETEMSVTVAFKRQ